MEPIGLFEFLSKEFGDIAHYKIGHQHILFLNNPEYIREVLVVQNENFIKERTVQRMKMLLGEGMINSEGAQHRVQRNFERTRHLEEVDIAFGQAVLGDFGGEGGAAAIDNLLVPAGLHKGDAFG
jgi:hypothetical protein